MVAAAVCDSGNPMESRYDGHEPDMPFDPNMPVDPDMFDRRRNPTAIPGLVCGVAVWGKVLQIPPTYDPDTYDPDGRMPWTPEPEPYDPETYAAWGRKHFGDDWFKQRQTMLQERNIYFDRDPVYRERQRALRILEHTAERRPFRPATEYGGFIEDNLKDEGWQRLWARMSKSLPPGDRVSNDDHLRLSEPRSVETDISGFSTYPPTPEFRARTPPPDDPWERLEWERRLGSWSGERYLFEKIFLKEGITDLDRRNREDEDGNKQREKEWEKIERLEWPLPEDPNEASRQLQEYSRRKARFDRLRAGLTEEEIDAEIRERHLREEAEREEDRRERDRRFRDGDTSVSRERLKELDVLFGLDRWQGRASPAAASPAGHAESGELLQSQAPSPRQAKSTPRKTRGGGVKKKAGQKQSGGRATRSRQPAPTHAAAALPPIRSRGRSKPDVPEVKLGDNTLAAPQDKKKQRKTYGKERSSRRLAGQLPEFGMLPARGEAPPLYKASLRQASNKLKASSSGPRSARLSKKPAAAAAAAKGAKPQGISKSKQDGPGRTKRPTRGSKRLSAK